MLVLLEDSVVSLLQKMQASSVKQNSYTLYYVID